MSALTDYLHEKLIALRMRKQRIDAGELGAKTLSAQVTAEGRSGIRRVRIRDFQLVTDAPPDLAGYNLGPSAPELLLGSLGSCIVHTLMLQAAWLCAFLTVSPFLSSVLMTSAARIAFNWRTSASGTSKSR